MEKIKLMVVDDIPQTRKDIIRLLYFEDDMIVLGESGDGADAVRKIGELQPDVVLMDINMPQMDGISATERVGHLYPQVAVIIISIQGESEYLKKAMVAGARDYLVKPLGSEEMANTIRSVYKQQRMRLIKYAGPQAEVADFPPAPAVIPQVSKDHISAGERRYLEQQPSRINQSHCVEPPCYRPDCRRKDSIIDDHHSDHMNCKEQHFVPEKIESSLHEPIVSNYHSQEKSHQELLYEQQNISDQPQTFYWESRQISHPVHENSLHQEQQQKPLVRDTEQQPIRENMQFTMNQHQTSQRIEEPDKERMQSATSQTQGVSQRAAEPVQESIQPAFNQPQGVSQQTKGTVKENILPKISESQEILQRNIEQNITQEKRQEKMDMKPEQEARTEKIKHEYKPQTVSHSDDKPLGFVTVVFSGKGGVGTTTIATNLAVSLAQQEKKKVALIDYDLQFGDISVLLNLSEGKNIGDMVRDESEINDEILENYMIRHFSGIDILPAPLFPQDAEYITADHTEKILQLLKKSYDYIVVDTAGSFDEINLRVMDLADRILLVTTRDIVTIKNTKTSLSILESLSYREKIRIVLNRGDQDLGVEIADLEKGLEMTVSHQVTSDEKALISSINKGVPVVISHSNTEISRSFKRLCDRLINVRRSSNSEKQSRGIINRMFSL
jgi:MinD-like ATPase involved in chromosome partitioning or flagellar assembly/DNA-binding NarL/FixJ family response regulator